MGSFDSAKTTLLGVELRSPKLRRRALRCKTSSLAVNGWDLNGIMGEPYSIEVLMSAR